MSQILQEHTCPICLHVFLNPVTLSKCKHVFCFRCLKNTHDYQTIRITYNSINTSQNQTIHSNKCPLCRQCFNFNLHEFSSDDKLKKTTQTLYPEAIKQKKKTTVIDKTVNLVFGHKIFKVSQRQNKFLKENLTNVTSSQIAKTKNQNQSQKNNQLWNWQFYIKNFVNLNLQNTNASYSSLKNKAQILNKAISKIEIRLHPQMNQPPIQFNLAKQRKQKKQQQQDLSQIKIERKTIQLFRIFIDIIWQQSCGGERTLLHHDLSQKNEECIAQIEMKLNPK